MDINGYENGYISDIMRLMFKAQIPNISNRVLNLISQIDTFKGEWKGIQNLSPKILNSMQRIATFESIGSSTRIEGVVLTNHEIEKLLSNLNIQKFKSRDEQEVAGYSEALNTINESWIDINLTENYIKQLHGITLKFSEKDIRHRGEYKKSPNNVVAFNEVGKQVAVIFETEMPFNTPESMRQLVLWVNEREANKDLHPLLIIAVFVLIFLAIHPFQDGNGRLSRLLTTFLLLKSGYEYAKYSSLEKIIEESKESYYLALRKAQSTICEENHDYEPWLVFFLQSLLLQARNLKEKVKTQSEKVDELNPDCLIIMDLFNTNDNLTLSDIVSITDKNRNTLKVRLKELVEKGLIKRHGKGRGVYYTKF